MGVKKVLAVAVWLVILSVVATTIQVARASQKQESCGSASPCTSSTWWWIGPDTVYYAQASSSQYPGTPCCIWYSARMRGTNWYHPGTWIDESYCDENSDPYTACTTNYAAYCTTDPPNMGCYNNTTRYWYATTKSDFDWGLGSYPIYSASDTAVGRDSASCYTSWNCFY